MTRSVPKWKVLETRANRLRWENTKTTALLYQSFLLGLGSEAPERGWCSQDVRESCSVTYCSSTSKSMEYAGQEVDSDSIFYRLRHGARTPLLAEEIRYLYMEATEVFLFQLTLLDLEAPTTVCIFSYIHLRSGILLITASLQTVGDIRGQFLDLLCYLELSSYPPRSKYVFLGNYFGSGKESVETICLLLAYKCGCPENIFLLRGRHETKVMSRLSGFFDECQRKCTGMWRSLSAVLLL